MATQLKPAVKSAAQALRKNLVRVLPASVTSIPVGSTTYTPQEVVAELQSGLGLIQAVVNAKLAVREAIKARDAALPDLESLVQSVQAFVKVMIPTDGAGQLACGVRARKKPAKLTMEEQTAKAALALATRRKNGTMGVRQRRRAEKAARAVAVAVVLGPDGKTLDGSPLPAPKGKKK